MGQGLAYWNERNEPIYTLHARMERWQVDSAYKVCCVRCVGERGHAAGGLVLVRRDDNARLRRYGMCVRCGQQYFFLDHSIAGEELPPLDGKQ